MRHQAAVPPIIIIGMHRSGTSLLARLLERAGLFVGRALNDDHEATFFLQHNEWLLRACGGSWDTPRCVDDLYTHEQGQNLVEAYLRLRLASPASVQYLGLRRFWRYRGMWNIREPWGWKDPRNTLTLPVWLRLFPDAAVLHVIRNGVDVARSLVRREQRALRIAEQRLRRYAPVMMLRAKQGWFGLSARVIRPEQAFSLWETYLGYADRFTRGGANPVLDIRYEDIVASPDDSVARAAHFCGLSPGSPALQQAAASVRGDSASAFARDETFYGFWQQVRATPWMQRYGYSVDPAGPSQ
jgi:hypothetical protein